MKVVVLISRILMGLVFVVFGLNGFLHFIPAKMPPGLAGQFAGALFMSHYFLFVAAVQVVGGVLLLVNRYVPLALALLGPVIVNILLYHTFLFSEGAIIAVIVALLWIILFVHYRQYFAGLFVRRARPEKA
jgi:uncharacterized membrane protein YphA (DoxX/SURF4 family)